MDKNKISTLIDKLIRKTEKGELSWNRLENGELSANTMVGQFVIDEDIDCNRQKSFKSRYDDGKVFLFGDNLDDLVLAVQPGDEKGLTNISAYNDIELSRLKNAIIQQVDDASDFLDKLMS